MGMTKPLCYKPLGMEYFSQMSSIIPLIPFKNNTWWMIIVDLGDRKYCLLPIPNTNKFHGGTLCGVSVSPIVKSMSLHDPSDSHF